MSASTNINGDLGTVITNSNNAATQAKNVNPAGPIVDYIGMVHSLRLNLREAQVLAGTILKATDSTDSSNVTALTAVQNAISGGSSPSGTLITAVNGVITAGPNAATAAKASNPAGPIIDYVGNLNGLLLMLKESLVKVKLLVNSTDSTDTANLALLQNVQTALS